MKDIKIQEVELILIPRALIFMDLDSFGVTQRSLHHRRTGLQLGPPLVQLAALQLEPPHVNNTEAAAWKSNLKHDAERAHARRHTQALTQGCTTHMPAASSCYFSQPPPPSYGPPVSSIKMSTEGAAPRWSPRQRAFTFATAKRMY